MFGGELLKVGAHQASERRIAFDGDLADLFHQFLVNGKCDIHRPIIRETLNMGKSGVAYPEGFSLKVAARYLLSSLEQSVLIGRILCANAVLGRRSISARETGTVVLRAKTNTNFRIVERYPQVLLRPDTCSTRTAPLHPAPYPNECSQ